MSPASSGVPIQNYDLLLRFGYLQVLDVLTTLAFLAHGIGEGNPLIALLIKSAGNPFAALLAVKAVAAALGVFCHVSGRFALLRRGNLFFAGLIVWNLIALILGSVK